MTSTLLHPHWQCKAPTLSESGHGWEEPSRLPEALGRIGCNPAPAGVSADSNVGGDRSREDPRPRAGHGRRLTDHRLPSPQ